MGVSDTIFPSNQGLYSKGIPSKNWKDVGLRIEMLFTHVSLHF